jgi:hypothetical protein
LNNSEALDWDTPIENEGTSFVVIPENTECTYTVLSMEKGHSERSNCPQAILEIEVVAIDGSGKAWVKDYLTLNRKSEWKLCEFFISNGQRKHGERIAPNWTKVPGCTGRCTVSVEPWQSNPDKFNNKIKKYLEPAEDQVPADAEEPSFG